MISEFTNFHGDTYIKLPPNRMLLIVAWRLQSPLYIQLPTPSPVPSPSRPPWQEPIPKGTGIETRRVNSYRACRLPLISVSYCFYVSGAPLCHIFRSASMHFCLVRLLGISGCNIQWLHTLLEIVARNKDGHYSKQTKNSVWGLVTLLLLLHVCFPFFVAIYI